MLCCGAPLAYLVSMMLSPLGFEGVALQLLFPHLSWLGHLAVRATPPLVLLGGRPWVHLHPLPVMLGGRAERRSYQHSRLACYTRTTGPASARTGRRPRMIQSGAPGRLLSLDDPVRGLLLLDPPRRIQPGGSGLFSPDDALLVLWPLLLLLPRMILSWALNGLVTVSLHLHGLLVLAVSRLQPWSRPLGCCSASPRP